MFAFNHRGMGSQQRVAVVFVWCPGANDSCFVPVSTGRLSRGAVWVTVLPWGRSTWVHFGVHGVGRVGSSRITLIGGQRSCLTAARFSPCGVW